MYSAGIDIGSVTVKAVLLEGEDLKAYFVMASGGDYRLAAETALSAALSLAALRREDLSLIAATGHDAAGEGGWQRVSEITAQGLALSRLFPETRAVIDIGGQATRVARLDEHGHVTDFAISEKCASGSGRFLQIMSRVLEVPLADMGPLSLRAKAPVRFSTGCAVFAESEAVSRITEGHAREDILAGVHLAIAVKVHSLLQRVRPAGACGLTGGGALDVGLVRRIEETCGLKALVPREPRITAAWGAALAAMRRVAREKEAGTVFK
jgi:predicted CoA-substrate-specific enzyme activase